MKKTSKTLMLFTVFFILFAGHATGQIEKSTAPPATMELDFPCPPEEIKITKFNGGKNWKIVVNRPFDYKATPKNGTDNWVWALGDLNASGDGVVPFWQFQNPLNAYSGTGLIPLANLPPNNADFGPAHGHIQATANLNGVPKKDLSDPPGETVKVFFNKDEVHPVSGVPNWFHYWEQIAANLLTTSGIRVFGVDSLVTEAVLQVGDPTPIAFSLRYRNDGPFHFQEPPDPNIPQLYAINNIGDQMSKFKFAFIAGGCYNDYRKVLTEYPDDLPDLAVIDIGEGCARHYRIYNYGLGPNAYGGPLPPQYSTIRGIDVFYALLNHELVHWTLFEEFWSVAGYDSTFDCDGDYYPDDWEMGPIGMSYGFIVGVKDEYTSNYNAENLPAVMPVNRKAATWFQEERCRRKEAVVQPGPHDQDWSFDSTGSNQGKQW